MKNTSLFVKVLKEKWVVHGIAPEHVDGFCDVYFGPTILHRDVLKIFREMRQSGALPADVQCLYQHFLENAPDTWDKKTIL
jgi:hypothetical protein